ncbi:TPA: hypothetical protein I9088_001390 [Clostridium perfringens]|nr:hypothetical protein [Clostridium perfringens]
MKITDAKTFIDGTLKYSISDIIGLTSYWYLDCKCNQWKDASGVVHELSDMSIKYLKNCKNQIKRSKKDCEKGNDNFCFAIERYLERKLNIDNSVKVKLEEFIKENVLERLDIKEEEIQSELDSR